jgi:hypothetical protein
MIGTYRLISLSNREEQPGHHEGIVARKDRDKLHSIDVKLSCQRSKEGVRQQQTQYAVQILPVIRWMKETAPYTSETGCGHEGTERKSTEHNIRAEQSILLCLLLVHTKNWNKIAELVPVRQRL